MFTMMSNFYSFVVVAVVIVVVAVFQVQGRPRRFYINENKENSLIRIFKSLDPSPYEMFCPRNIEGIHGIVQNNETIAGCGVDYNLCDDDYDCEPGLKCCPSGCIYKCVVPEKLKTAVAIDWVREPEALTVGGNAWLIEGDGTGLSAKIDCSTSEFQWMEPRKCPNGFYCKLEDEGDASKQIPNRGVCMRGRDDDSVDLTQLLSSDPLPLGSSCIINGKEILHGQVRVLDCKLCFCKDGEVFCRFFPCFNKKTL